MSVGNYAMVNKHPIYYEQFGVGRPVVLLHGGFHTMHLSFETQIAPFAEQHHVIAIEQVGHGHSADIEGPFSYARMAEDTLLGRFEKPHGKVPMPGLLSHWYCPFDECAHGFRTAPRRVPKEPYPIGR